MWTTPSSSIHSGRDQIGNIVHILLKDIQDRLAEEQMTLRLTPDAVDFLTDKGYDEKFGARPLKRAIQRYLEDPLSEKILVAEFSAGDEIEVGVAEGGDGFSLRARSHIKT